MDQNIKILGAKVPIIKMVVTVSETGDIQGDIKINNNFTQGQKDALKASFKQVMTVCTSRINQLWAEKLEEKGGAE